MSARRGLLAASATIALLGMSTMSARATTKTEGVPAFGHVFVIIGENTEYSQVTPGKAPYLLGTLKPASAWLTNYFAVTHYSEANYVAMTSGQFTPCEQHDGLAASCHQGADNFFAQLDGIDVTWQSWMESMPAPCTLTNTGGDATLNHYAAKHNPAVFFDGIEGQNGVWSPTPGPECTANDIPAGSTGPNDMSTFEAALASGNVARFNLVVPNECEDAHDNCKPAGNPILQFDQFLQREVHLIESSPAFGTDGVIVVTFDEGITNGPNHADHFGNGGNVVFAVISPLAVPGTYTAFASDHYGFLRTMEDGFGLTTYLENANLVPPINEIWAP
ncbi:MAG TPA: alkaline phosphatase family protein [Actinomycetota bacterium]|nr:alkaline phosphatase family protein [Actinomycetota bacterium]